MKREEIELLLTSGSEADQKKFSAYIIKLLNAKDRNGNLRNQWALNRKPEVFAEAYESVFGTGLKFDGEHVTLQKTGITFDYQAYKKRMFISYPETEIDIQLVYEGDDISIEKVSGKVIYNHKLSNPFGAKDADIIGGYCVIKNKRGEFFTALSPDDIEKRRKVAKTDSIWSQWFPEMCLKTIVKRACSFHFSDEFQAMETLDNENYDLNQDPGRDEGQELLELAYTDILELLEEIGGAKAEEVRKRIKLDRGAGKVNEAYLKNLYSKLSKGGVEA